MVIKAKKYNKYGKFAIKWLKFFTGAMLVIYAAYILVNLGYVLLDALLHHSIIGEGPFISQVLLIIIVLELARTLFAYIESEEQYLASILEASLIAVLRSIILSEMKNMSYERLIALAILVLAVGYVYYRLRLKPLASEKG